MAKAYPLWVEKLIFYSLIGTAIYIGFSLQDYLDGAFLWLARICALPILILVRLFQSVYLNRQSCD